MTSRGRIRLLLLLGGGVLLLDQVTKLLVDGSMRLYATRPVIPGILDLHYIRNTGSAFGFLSGSQSAFRIPFFVVVSLVAIGIILYLFRKLEDSEEMVPYALSLVLGGAVGNLVDRVRLGEVIDFIYIHHGRFAWPAFNVADIGITVGVGLLILRMFVLERRSKRDAGQQG